MKERRREGTYRHDKRVGESGDRISELIGKLDVMLVQPTPGDEGDPIESSDAGLREEASEEVTNNTANSVRSEYLDPSEQQKSLEK